MKWIEFFQCDGLKMGNVVCKPLKLSLVEESENKLMNYLNHKRENGDCLHFIILEGNFIYVVINWCSPFFAIKAFFVNEFGKLKSLISLLTKKECLDHFKDCISPSGAKAIEDSEKKAKKLVEQRFHSTQTTDSLRLDMMIAMNR